MLTERALLGPVPLYFSTSALDVPHTIDALHIVSINDIVRRKRG